MDLRNRSLIMAVGLAALVVGLLAVPSAARADVVYLNGYVTSVNPEGDCVLVRDETGKMFYLSGAWTGLIGNDYVRLEGSFIPDARCGAPGGFNVVEVRTVWGDEHHKVIYYDRDRDGVFRTWVEKHRRHERREKERERSEHEPPPL
jgi:hypothetical protein